MGYIGLYGGYMGMMEEKMENENYQRHGQLIETKC